MMMRFCALLLATAGLSVPAFAGDKPLYGPAPAFVVAAPAPDLSKKDKLFLILDSQQELRDGRVTAYLDTASQVISAEALPHIGQITIPWEPAKGDLTVHRVLILRGGEQIDLLQQGKAFEVLRREEQLEQFMVTGVLTASMAVEGLRVGDVLRVTYSTTGTDTALDGGMQAVMATPTLPIPLDFGRVRLLWPKAKSVTWRGYADGLTGRSVERDLGAMHEVTVTLPLPKPAETPADMPMRFAKLPVVEATSFADWPAVSRTMAPLFATAGLIAPGSALDRELAAITAAEKEPLGRAQRALELVQDQVRYLGVFMNNGNYVPQTPARTWELRYGDCKAKTLLLLAMLHRMGIEAEPVLASLQGGGFVEKRLPAPMAFDHVLVRATISGRTLWLDGTRTGDRLADIGNVPQLVTVLPLRTSGAGLMSVTASPPARPSVEIDTVFDQSAGVSLPPVVDLQMRFTGAQAAQMGAMTAIATTEQKRQLANGMLRSIVGESQFTDPVLTYDAKAASFTVKVRGVVTTPWRQREGRYRMPVAQLDNLLAFEADRARAAWKDIPVMTGAPAMLTRRTVVILPAEARDAALEGTRVLNLDVVGRHVTRNTSFADGRLAIEDRIAAAGVEIPPAALPAERARLAQLKSGVLTLVAPAAMPTRVDVIRTGGRGRFKPLETHYSDALKIADANETEGLRSRANFRAGIYDHAGAIEDYTKAIAIQAETDSLSRRAALFNMVGQPAKALADRQAAHDLDPGDVDLALALAEQLSITGKHKEALTLLDERAAQGGEDRQRLLSEKADVLVRMGDGAGAVAVMDAAIASKPGAASLLNGRCWTKATGNLMLDTALKDCTRAIELSEDASAALDSRGVVYFRMGRMEEALADFDAVLTQDWNMPATLFMRGVVHRRMGHGKEAERDLANAALMNPSLAATYAAWGIKP